MAHYGLTLEEWYGTELAEIMLERKKAYHLNWKKEHRDKVRQYWKTRYKNHYEKELQRLREKNQKAIETGYFKQYRKKKHSLPSHRLYEKLRNKKRNGELRYEILSHYSNGIPRCANCGIQDIRVLSLDHINNDGAKQKKAIGLGYGISYLYWIKRHNYPSDLQVLCMNCQWVKRAEQLDKKFNEESNALKVLAEKEGEKICLG